MSLGFAPGKLFLAGEYGVVRPHMPALLFPVDRGVTVRTSALVPHGVNVGKILVHSPALSSEPLCFEPGAAASASREPVMRALDVAVELCAARGVQVGSLRLDISSTLADPDGRKYGFGSSGAVIVAVIDAVASHAGIKLSAEELFKAASLAVIAGDRRASCADIALCVTGTLTWFRSCDRDAAHAMREELGVAEAIARPWAGLDMRPVYGSPRVRVVIGWSGKPASSANLVQKVGAGSAMEGGAFDAFCAANEAAVGRALAELEADDVAGLKDTVRAVQRQLEQLDAAGGAPAGIVTEELARVIALAEGTGAAAKVSGAGGGDCAIAVCEGEDEAERVRRAWQAEGFRCLGTWAGSDAQAGSTTKTMMKEAA